MKIVLGSLSFSSVQEFTEYLTIQYEQKQLSTQEVHLKINYEALDTKSNNELIQFLREPERSRIYKINLISEPLSKEQSMFNRLLIDAYRANKKQKKSIPINEELPPVKIRKAKKHWIEGTKDSSISYRVQDRAEGSKRKLKINDSIPTIDMLFETVIQDSKAKNSEVDVEQFKLAITKTKEVVDSKAKDIPNLVSWLTLLLNDCRITSRDDLLIYLNLISKLDSVNNQILKQWMLVHHALAEHGIKRHAGLLLNIQSGLEKHSTLLNSIVELFNYKPYLDTEKFIAALAKDRKKLKSNIEQFDRDPTGSRAPILNKQGQVIKSTEQILREQFDTSQVYRVIAKMLNLVEGDAVTAELQYELAQQVIYINAIGKDHPVVVRNKIYNDLTRLSRAELRDVCNLLISQVRAPIFGEHTKLSRLKARLNLLAVMREQYFRITGQFIDTTQLVSILMSLNALQSNVLMQIDQEEKRKVATQFFAAMQWVETDGGSVVVLCSSQDLSTDDYLDKKAKLFFTAIGMPSAVIDVGDPVGTYQVGGINYTTIANLALYHSRAQKENEDLTANKYDRKLSSSLIINGLDFSTLSSNTVFDLFVNSDKASSLQENSNPYSWIYPLINEFINQKEFRTLEVSTDEVWDEESDLANLKLFLESKVKTSEHREQLLNLSDTTLNNWINLACKAQQMVEGQDFIIDSRSTSFARVVPVYLKSPQDLFVFHSEMQHFLNARLQKQYPSIQLAIVPEGTILDSASSKELFDFYKQNGRIIAIFGTSGLKNALAKQCNELGIELAYKIPSHDQYQRQELYSDNLPISQSGMKKIKDIIAQAQSGQPIVLLVQDAYQVEQLFRELSELFAKDRKVVQIGAFTGDESEEVRKNWIENQAGQSNTITISTPLLTKGATFKTEYENGLLGIHTYAEAPNKARKLINKMIPRSKPGQYVMIYENDGVICSSSWTYQAGQEKNGAVDVVAKIYRKKNQEFAVEHYYIRAVSNIQLAVFQQLDEWQAFLHLLYPKKEWKKLDSELSLLREELNTILEEKWIKCLKQSDPDQEYHNSYIRWDKNGTLKTSVLEKVLKEYEQVVASIWKIKCDILKAKTDGKIQTDWVNVLRCYYLENISLEEQLKFIKITERQNRKTAIAQQKKTDRIRDVGLDVNGAMLAYSDAPKEQYRLAFEKNQIRLLITDIVKIINFSPLSVNAKSVLNERLQGIDSFLALAGFLNNYFNLFDSDNLTEKYRMQPIINEVIRLYEYSGLQLREAQDLEVLKTIYIDNVAFDIVSNVEQNLSWVLESNRGWGVEYWFERTAVKQAAHEILIVVSSVKDATDTPTRQAAIKNLYRVLAHHQAQLDELWIFSFGHKNTRDLINQTLRTLDTLRVIGSGYDQLDITFIEECKEHAYSDVMKAKFNAVVEHLEHQNSGRLSDNPQWNSIKYQIKLIQSENKTIYAIDELYYLLSKTSKELNLSSLPANATLFKFIIELRGELRTIWDKFYHSHKEMISESNHLRVKADHIKSNLQELRNYQVNNVVLNHNQNGFSEYFDLLIEGIGSCPLFNDFLSYNQQFTELDKERDNLVSQRERIYTQIRALKKLQNEQLSELRSKHNGSLDIELFPLGCRKKVHELSQLRGFINGRVPEDLSCFSPEIQDLFHDRELIKHLEFPQFTLEQVDQLKDKKLKAQLVGLFNKIHSVPSQQKPGFVSKLVSYIVSSFVKKECLEDWAYQFSILKGDPHGKLQSLLQSKANEILDTLSAQLSTLEFSANNTASLLEEKIHFIQQEINAQIRKSSVITKRFENLEQLYDFATELKNYNGEQITFDVTKPIAIKDNVVALEPVVVDVVEPITETTLKI